MACAMWGVLELKCFRKKVIVDQTVLHKDDKYVIYLFLLLSFYPYKDV